MLYNDIENHEASSTQHHLKLALNKITNQQEQIQFLMTIQNRLLERLSKVENKSDALLLMKDEHIWKIPRFYEELQKGKNLGKQHTLSKFIYTSKGYKLECVLYPYNIALKSGSLFYKTAVGRW